MIYRVRVFLYKLLKNLAFKAMPATYPIDQEIAKLRADIIANMDKLSSSKLTVEHK